MGALSKAFARSQRSPLTAELKDILRLLNELEDFNLTNWESEFVAGLQDTISVYQGEARITDAQGDWLNRLADKYDLEPA
jgi:hypothetical protein